MITFGVGYDNGVNAVKDDETSAIEDNWGVSVGYAIGAASFTGAYAANGITSYGVAADYDLGNGVVVGATYAVNDGEDDTYGVTADYSVGAATFSGAYLNDNGEDEFSLDATFDAGNNITLMAGTEQQPDNTDLSMTNYYVAASFDLGSGASVLLAYATDDAADPATEEVGSNDYYEGITLEVSMKF